MAQNKKRNIKKKNRRRKTRLQEGGEGVLTTAGGGKMGDGEMFGSLMRNSYVSVFVDMLSTTSTTFRYSHSTNANELPLISHSTNAQDFRHVTTHISFNKCERIGLSRK